MRISLVSVSAVATLAASVSFLCIARPSSSPATTHPASPTPNAEGSRVLGRLPVAFVPNLGQWQHSARYVARVGAMTVFLEQRGWTFTLVERTAEKGKGSMNDDTSARGVAVRMTFAGASVPELIAEEQLPGRHNYFLGSDASKWRSDVPLHGAVRYREVRSGIDVRAREQDGHFEYDLILQPAAEIEPMEIAVEGIERMRLDAEGALVMETAVGPVRMPAPSSWQEGPAGEKTPVACRYQLRGGHCFGFEVAGRRPDWTLVVDPGLVWSTYLGGIDSDECRALALDAQGAATVAGHTYSATYPTTPGAFDTSFNGPRGNADAFVAKLSPTGSSLVFSTFLGGATGDGASAVAVDAQGAVTVAGWTSSADFPTTAGAFDTTYNGGNNDAFVTRLSPTGASLVYSTFLGGILNDVLGVPALALDGQGMATFVGSTGSADFPTTPGAFDTSYNGNRDGYVVRIAPSGGSLVYATFLGTPADDDALAVVLDSQGAALVAGSTESASFPTTPGAFDTTHNGGNVDAFVTKLAPSGSSLLYSTFLGGTSWDVATAVAIDVQGAATIAGYTSSTDFPTTPGAFDTSYNGIRADAFVTRLASTGSSLVYSTFLGGTDGDWANAVALDARGAATIAGSTDSGDFPTTPGAFDTTYNAPPYYSDAFVSRLSPTGASLVYSTYLGGTEQDIAFGVALDADGSATIAGYTLSPTFPTTPGAYDTTLNGRGSPDAFITRLDLLPTGVAAFGRSSPGCTGPLAISVASMPRVGNQTFALTCGNAPPSTTGLLGLAGTAFTSPFVLLGAEVWIDPSLLFIGLPSNSNAIGASEVILPIPNVRPLAGVRLFAQFLWGGAASPPPCPPLGLSASNALGFTIQP